MEDWQFGMMSRKSSVGGRSRSMRSGEDQEFEEKDMWSLVRDREVVDCSSHKMKMKAKDGSSAWQHHSASKLIPRGSAVAVAAAASATPTETRLQQSSAPVTIPDWSKIYGRNGSNWADFDDHDHDGDGYGYDHHDYGGDGDDDMVPPHEWVARKLAGTQISSFSMCEGIGRTLKGRDLSKVRNAVLTKTGFLE